MMRITAPTMTSTGMPNSSPCANQRNSSGAARKLTLPPPPVPICCTLRPMKRVPSVARKGVTPRRTMRNELSSPTTAPPAMPARIARGQGASKLSIAASENQAPKSSATATERSIPPEATTRVMASATSRRTTLPSTTLERLPSERKFELAIAKMANRTAKAPTKAKRVSSRPRRPTAGRAPVPACAPLISGTALQGRGRHDDEDQHALEAEDPGVVDLDEDQAVGEERHEDSAQHRPGDGDDVARRERGAQEARQQHVDHQQVLDARGAAGTPRHQGEARHRRRGTGDEERHRDVRSRPDPGRQGGLAVAAHRLHAHAEGRLVHQERERRPRHEHQPDGVGDAQHLSVPDRHDHRIVDVDAPIGGQDASDADDRRERRQRGQDRGQADRGSPARR